MSQAMCATDRLLISILLAIPNIRRRAHGRTDGGSVRADLKPHRVPEEPLMALFPVHDGCWHSHKQLSNLHGIGRL